MTGCKNGRAVGACQVYRLDFVLEQAVEEIFDRLWYMFESSVFHNIGCLRRNEKGGRGCYEAHGQRGTETHVVTD